MLHTVCSFCLDVDEVMLYIKYIIYLNDIKMTWEIDHKTLRAFEHISQESSIQKRLNKFDLLKRYGAGEFLKL